VYVQDVQGLGRGKGFKTLEKMSILDNRKALAPLKTRLLDLLQLFYRKGIITIEDLSRIGLLPSVLAALEDESDAGAADLEETERDIDYLLQQVGSIVDLSGYKQFQKMGRLKMGVKVLGDDTDDLLQKLGSVVDLSSYRHFQKMGRLKVGVKALVDEVEAGRASLEEDSRK